VAGPRFQFSLQTWDLRPDDRPPALALAHARLVAARALNERTRSLDPIPAEEYAREWQREGGEYRRGLEARGEGSGR
jgi:hypothetical protein